MKKITRFIANDGRWFSSKADCTAYEDGQAIISILNKAGAVKNMTFTYTDPNGDEFVFKHVETIKKKK